MNILNKDYKMKVTPKQSRAVQEACFANGITWNAGSQVVKYTNEPYLYIRTVGTIAYGDEDEESFFEDKAFCPIEPESFIAMLKGEPKGHPHAELMAIYAQDATETETPWERWEYYSQSSKQWTTCVDHPRWGVDVMYHRKPDVIKVGKHEFPCPTNVPLNNEMEYWTINLSSKGAHIQKLTWKDDSIDFNLLKSGQCHLTREAAEQHAAVLNAINRGDV